MTQTLSTCLWFDDNAEEAVEFYISLFDDARITDRMLCTEAGPWTEGSVLALTFELLGREFVALNGGPQHTFNEAHSMFVTCDTQAEIDSLWARFLAEGGEEIACGWLKDRFGLRWQVVPKGLLEFLGGDDKAAAARAMRAMMDMVKLDIAAVEAAYNGETQGDEA